MRISRVVIENFRAFNLLDVSLAGLTTCIIGENNTGKSNFLHAIRLCLDANLSSAYRALQPNDINSSVDISDPCQVMIGVEIVDFIGKVNEEALVGAWQSSPGLARLIYRFRPKLSVREDIEAKARGDGDLVMEDYHWEIVGGGDPTLDLVDIDWDDDVGSSIRFADLQSFLVVLLPALRDVESDLRQPRLSPLARLISASEIDLKEQESLLLTLREANAEIAASKTVSALAKAIDKAFKNVAGPAFSMDVGLGIAEPTFQAIVRALRILLSNAAMTNFDPSSNGLGLNNILYISILIEYFQKRLEQNKSAGQIILFEEPEAHLHPQLQLALFSALSALPFQTILTTHSTHITARAPLRDFVVLTQTADGTAPTVPSKSTTLNAKELEDLERYLDATKSNLLYARKVILVEGPAELFLIPPLVLKVKGIDLDRQGISVIPIYGVHFDVYAKLFSVGGLPKKCAIIADGDLKPSDLTEGDDDEEYSFDPPNLKDLESDYVRVFTNATTFERAVTMSGTLPMWAAAAGDIGAKQIAGKLRAGIKALAKDNLSKEDRQILLEPLRASVLNTAKRFGKARFAQIAARHVDEASVLPTYIEDAVKWLLEE